MKKLANISQFENLCGRHPSHKPAPTQNYSVFNRYDTIDEHLDEPVWSILNDGVFLERLSNGFFDISEAPDWFLAEKTLDGEKIPYAYSGYSTRQGEIALKIFKEKEYLERYKQWLLGLSELDKERIRQAAERDSTSPRCVLEILGPPQHDLSRITEKRIKFGGIGGTPSGKTFEDALRPLIQAKKQKLDTINKKLQSEISRRQPVTVSLQRARNMASGRLRVDKWRVLSFRSRPTEVLVFQKKGASHFIEQLSKERDKIHNLPTKEQYEKIAGILEENKKYFLPPIPFVFYPLIAAGYTIPRFRDNMKEFKKNREYWWDRIRETLVDRWTYDEIQHNKAEIEELSRIEEGLAGHPATQDITE